MARMDDGGGGGSASVANLFKSVAKAGSGAARQQQRKNRTTRRAVQNVARAGFGAARRASRSSSRSSRSSSGNNGYSRSSRGGNSGYTQPRVSRPQSGANASGAIAPTVPAPVIPKFDQNYLSGDTAYSSQKSAYQKALADFAAQQGADRTNYGNEYNASVTQMQKDQSQGALDLKDDYAARGLLTSGVYSDALNDFNADYTNKFNELARAKAAYEGDLTNANTNFKTQQQLLLDKAKQDALNRYNDKYGK